MDFALPRARVRRRSRKPRGPMPPWLKLIVALVLAEFLLVAHCAYALVTGKSVIWNFFLIVWITFWLSRDWEWIVKEFRRWWNAGE